jgi:SpoVK/Ycf46/Vps4 family AAA+-type ATPase
VLLHGPPGNGKTSLIRWIGQRLPQIPGLILRPAAAFDTDDLTAVIRRWTHNAPGVLVIEDLDWLLKQVDVSAFLNLIDGVESHATGGLLLLATTNHPEKLDPAVNNRPGRFDVVIEIPSPDEWMRLEYLRKHLPGIADETIRASAKESDGLAFAHLEEIVRLSGLRAIAAGRTSRADEDVLSTVRAVREAYDEAIRGFPPAKPELPFGLGPLRDARRRDR